MSGQTLAFSAGSFLSLVTAFWLYVAAKRQMRGDLSTDQCRGITGLCSVTAWVYALAGGWRGLLLGIAWGCIGLAMLAVVIMRTYPRRRV